MSDNEIKNDEINEVDNQAPEAPETTSDSNAGNPVLAIFQKKSVILLIIIVILAVFIFLITNKSSLMNSSSSNNSANFKPVDSNNQNVFNSQQIKDHPPINLSQISQPKQSGTYWSQAGNIVFSDKGLEVKLGKTYTNKKFEVSFDNNDNYEITFYLAKEKVGVVIVPKRTEPNLQGLFVSLNKIPDEVVSKGYDKVMIVPYEGDGMYSIGHLRFLD